MKNLTPDFERRLNRHHLKNTGFSIDIFWEEGLAITYNSTSLLNELSVDWLPNYIIPGGAFSLSVALNVDASFYQEKEIAGSRVDLYFEIDGFREYIGTGNIEAPITYSNRLLQFNVFSKQSSSVIGGLSINSTTEAKECLPLIFGSVCGSPCVKIESAIIGTLETDETIHDYTLEARMGQVKEIACPNYVTRIEEDGVVRSATDTGCLEAKKNAYCSMSESLDEQFSREHKTVEITNGELFPQNTPYEIIIQDGVFQGYFSGNTYYIQGRTHPLEILYGSVETIELPPVEVQFINPFSTDGICAEEIPEEFNYKKTQVIELNRRISDIYDFCHESETCWMTGDKNQYYINMETYEPDYLYILPKYDPDWEALGIYHTLIEGFTQEDLVTKILSYQKTFDVYYNMKIADEFVAPSGSKVVKNSSGPSYIASLLPGTVLKVMAYKTSTPGFVSKLVEIPSEYYTIEEVNYGDFNAVEIHFNSTLAQISACLEEGIYVDFESDLGGNPIDILEWLVTNYTDLTVDETSFSSLREKLANYPIGFTLAGEESVYTLLKNIAYQSRCVLSIWDGVIYIQYAAETPTPVMTIDESNLFEYTISGSEIISTREKVTWYPTYAPPLSTTPVGTTLYLEQNQKYGVIDTSSIYYCLNTFPLLKKSSSFWFVRNSNSWKKVTCKVPLSFMKLNIYDSVYFQPLATIAIVEATTITEDHVLLDLWTPIRLGENEEYYWAWPANKPNKQYQPEYSNVIGRPLAVSYYRNLDEYPTDLGDEADDPYCYCFDFNTVPCYTNGEDGYWNDGEYQDNDFSIPHGGPADPADPEYIWEGGGWDDFPYNYDNREADYQDNPDIGEDALTIETPGTCWFWHTVFKWTCDKVYCGAPGPCDAKHQECQCAPLCCKAHGLICTSEVFSSCRGNMASWRRHLQEQEQENCDGKTKIYDVQPQPSPEIRDCCSLPNQMWKTPSKSEPRYPGDHDLHWINEFGARVSCDYYCHKTLQEPRTSVGHKTTSNTGESSGNAKADVAKIGSLLDGVCTGQGVEDALVKTGLAHEGASGTIEYYVNKDTGVKARKGDVTPYTYDELYEAQGGMGSTAFQNQLVRLFGYNEAVRIFTENAYQTEISPKGAIIYYYDGQVIFVDKSRIPLNSQYYTTEAIRLERFIAISSDGVVTPGEAWSVKLEINPDDPWVSSTNSWNNNFVRIKATKGTNVTIDGDWTATTDVYSGDAEYPEVAEDNTFVAGEDLTVFNTHVQTEAITEWTTDIERTF